MKSTVSAVFESLDLAEVAARKLRETYPQIVDIKIKYNTVNDSNGNYDDNNFFPVIAGAYGANAVQTPTGYFPYALGAIINDISYGRDNEVSHSTKSKIVVKADQQVEKAICATLTSMGGLQVKSIHFTLK